MNKNYSLIVGVLAGSLIFSAHSVEASMSTENPNTTSEAKSNETQTWSSPFQYNYNFNKPAEDVQQTSQTPVNPITSKQEVVKQNPVQTAAEGKVPEAIQEVVDLTNQERTKAGLKPLIIDLKLTQSAQAKSQDMKNKNYFDHTSPTYGSPFDQMKSLGITYKSAGENIAMGQRSAAEVMDAWMKSPGHRENIMNPSYTHIGVGLSDSGYYWTQQFIGK